MNLYAIFAFITTILAASWVLADKGICDPEEIENEASEVVVAFEQAGSNLPAAPSEFLGVKFLAAEPKLGECLSPERFIFSPTAFVYDADPKINYTVVFVMPSAVAPVLSDVLISLCMNVDGATLSVYAGNRVVAPWIFVNPAPGSAQWVYGLLYKQRRSINLFDSTLIDLSIRRVNFNLAELVAKYSLGDPVAGIVWKTAVPKNYGKNCGVELGCVKNSACKYY
ncbi:uncharacterized protein LOC112052685 [Bicyclus anynana]|uniref:Uncharacterized protein LOC112052685 n=1 Tax=Bicyclus anynana TaxID=110368 RepID=A0A6J1NIR3_BICAN|nr:uncharacterized protein LOC112052685 [Bicyclus anynana]